MTRHGSTGRRAGLLAMVEQQPVDEGVTGLGASLQQLCRAARVILDCTGVAVQLATSSGISGVLAASDPRARTWADLAFVVGEGPCHLSWRSGRTVTSADLRHPGKDRWPGFSAAAVDAGLTAVAAFPLTLGVSVIGILEVFDESPRGFDDGDVSDGVALAQLGTEMMIEGSRMPEAGLTRALDFRAEVAQAQGMVMVDLGVDPAEALVRLRAHSFATGVPLVELSRQVIDGFVLPNHNGAGPTVDPGRETS